MKKLIPAPLLLAAAAGALLIAGCGQQADGPSPERDVRTAVLPKAELVFIADLKAANESPFIKAVDAESQKQPTPQSRQMEEALEELGLAEEDLEYMSVSVAGIAQMQQMQQSGSTQEEFAGAISAVIAVSLAKPVTAEELRSVLVKYGDVDEAEIETTEIGGFPALAAPEKPGEPRFALLTRPRESGSLVLLGTFDELANALQRIDAGTDSMPAFVADVASKLLENQFGYLVYDIPPELRAALSEQMKGNPMAASFAQPLGTLSNVGLGMAAEEDFNVELLMRTGSPEDAQTLKGLFDSQVLFFVRMIASQQTGEVPQFVEGMTTTVEGNAMHLSLTMTQEEMLNFMQMAAGQNSPGAGMPAPGQGGTGGQ